MLSFVAGAIIAASFANSVNAECANACNGHGKCTAYDMCICNRNWQGNDCNQRTCQFGLAHVDTPKGDLDMDGSLSGPDNHVVNNHPVYPYGTREQFPQMEDTDLRPLPNSAHYYMECSNKGTCNRATGECQCFDGYDGVACQRASCPGFPASCSGHGVCKTISALAAADYGNSYKLWDRDSTMGCECDAGYYGPDCSKRDCKWGVDPLYLDDAATAKVATWDIAVLNSGATTSTGFRGMSADGVSQSADGYWAIRFYDAHGEDWLTTAIKASGTDLTGATIADTGASCAEVVKVLEELPNNVIPSGSVSCEATTFTNQAPLGKTSTHSGHAGHTYTYYYNLALWNSLTISDPFFGDLPNVYSGGTTEQDQKFTGTIYRLKFSGNPGNLKSPEVELYLDGKRPSLIADTDANKVVTFVSTDGQGGEDYDYFADHCDGVTVTINAITTVGNIADVVTLGGLTDAEKKLLKVCLGDSDGDLSTNYLSDGTTANTDVENWDYGSNAYPHLIKLVRTVTTYQDGGYYAALIFDGTNFNLLNPFIPLDTFATDSYDIYTTTGTLQRAVTSAGAAALSSTLFGYGQRHVVTTVKDLQTGATDTAWSGNLGCEGLSTTDTASVNHCMNHSDLFTVLAPLTQAAANPPYINLYRATRVWTTPYKSSGGSYDVIDTAADASADDDVATDDIKKRQLKRGIHVIETDLGLNWGGDDRVAQFNVYKFVPATASTYHYVAPCSNRGICNEETGICQCFPGYTSDSCSVQNSLAL